MLRYTIVFVGLLAFRMLALLALNALGVLLAVAVVAAALG